MKLGIGANPTAPGIPGCYLETCSWMWLVCESIINWNISSIIQTHFCEIKFQNFVFLIPHSTKIEQILLVSYIISSNTVYSS